MNRIGDLNARDAANTFYRGGAKTQSTAENARRREFEMNTNENTSTLCI
jgi:hypothetical protein